MLFLSLFLHLSLNKGASLLADGDTGYHIRAGEWILAHFSIPHQDMFSFHSPPLPWTAHEWLSEVIMALIHGSFGLTGEVVFFSLVLSLVTFLLFRMVRTSGGNIILAVLVVLLATISSQIHWLARPHVFSLLLFLVWFWILDDHRQGVRNRLCLLPPILLLWVNLHGGFLSGFILLGIFIIGQIPDCFSKDTDYRHAARRRLKALTLTTIVCVPVSCINPYGYHILLFPFNLVGNKMIMDFVVEFMSPNFHEPIIFKYLLLSLLAVLALSRERLHFVEVLLLLVFLNMSLYSARYIPLFAIVSAPTLLRHGDLLLKGSSGRLCAFLSKRSENFAKIDGSAGGLLWLVAAGVAVVWCVMTGTVRYEFDPKAKPVAAVSFLEKAQLPGNMFNDDEYGDYVIYAAWPRYRVFFDGRSDMYGTNMLKDYIKVVNFEENWEKVLDRYRINWIFIPAKSHLTRFLKERRDWSLIYEDKVATIFMKNVPRNREILEKYSSTGKTPLPSANRKGNPA
jgi:hypothetical protein